MKRRQGNLRRIIDIGMTVLLLLQMAYQVMGEAAHEWLGMTMTVLVIVHQILNRRWYIGQTKLHLICSINLSAIGVNA